MCNQRDYSQGLQEGNRMSEYQYSICAYCSHKKCKAYNCNMLEELDEVLYCKIDDYVDKILPQLIKEWKESNKIVKEYR